MFTKKNLLMIVGRHIVLALLAVGITMSISFFIMREIKQIANSINQKYQLVNKLEKRTELISTLEKDAQKVGTNYTKIEDAFVPSNNIFTFISSLENLALKNGVTQTFNFNSPELSPVQGPFQLSSIRYQNTLSANATSLTSYLKDFENLPYFTKMENLSIHSSDPLGIKGVSSASFQATLYAKTVQ